jgi:hypothetical protein
MTRGVVRQLRADLCRLGLPGSRRWGHGRGRLAADSCLFPADEPGRFRVPADVSDHVAASFGRPIGSHAVLVVNELSISRTAKSTSGLSFS